MTFNASALAASLVTVDKPAVTRVSNKENPFNGVALTSKEDGKARQVVVPFGTERRGTKDVEHVTTVKTLIRNAAYADGVGVGMMVQADEKAKTHTITFWGKVKTERPRKAADPVTVIPGKPSANRATNK